MQPLTVITGPAGAGKSTVASALAGRLSDTALVRGDAFFGFLGDDIIPPWLPAAQPQNEVVLEAAAACAGAFARRGYTTIYDGVIGPWFVTQFCDWAGMSRIHYVVLLPPVSVCLDRVRNRADHGFADEEVTRAMHAEFTSAAAGSSHVVDSAEAAPNLLVDIITDPSNEVRFRWSAS